MRLDSSLEIYVELERPITIENQKNLYHMIPQKLEFRLRLAAAEFSYGPPYHMIKPPPTNRYKQLVKSTNRP